jgi:hypothetical protein
MGDVSLDMVWKRLEEIQTDLKAVRADVADLKETARVLAKTNVIIQRDLSTLKDRVTVLTVAFDEQPPAHV